MPNLPDTGTADRQALDSKFKNKAFAKAKMKQYGVDSEDLAKRMYFRDLIYGDIPMMPKRSIGSGRNEAPAEGD